MVEKQKPISDAGEHNKKDQHNQDSHAHLLADSGFSKPPKSDPDTIQWPGGGKRTFERDENGCITKVNEKDGTSYELAYGGGMPMANHKKGEQKLSTGSLTIDDKTKEVRYQNNDNETLTILKPNGSSIVRQHKVGMFSSDGPVLEIHNPPKADGTPGDTRKFTYDASGKNIVGYSVISADKNLCSSWKSEDGKHWRKVDDKGNPVPVDKDPKKEAKNVLLGTMEVASNGDFVFHNKVNSDDEREHYTVVTADGKRHERVTSLENQQASDSLHKLQVEMVRAHFDEIKPNNPVGWMGLIGMDDVNSVLKDPNRSEAQKTAAAILKYCMKKHGITIVHSNELNGKVFQDTVAHMSPQDLAMEETADKS